MPEIWDHPKIFWISHPGSFLQHIFTPIPRILVNNRSLFITIINLVMQNIPLRFSFNFYAHHVCSTFIRSINFTQSQFSRNHTLLIVCYSIFPPPFLMLFPKHNIILYCVRPTLCTEKRLGFPMSLVCPTDQLPGVNCSSSNLSGNYLR